MRTALFLLLLAACTRDENPKIEALQKRIEILEARVGTGAARPNAQAQRPRRPEPDAKDVYAVTVDDLPMTGKPDALVTIVEGYEYACPACDGARPAIAQTLAKYGDKVRVVYKPYIVHPATATDAAMSACAAHEQGKFAAMDAAIWEKAYATRDFSPAKLQSIAQEIGLDMDRYAKDLPRCREKVMKHHAELQTLGQGGTPTFFVNGRYVVGANTPKIHAIIDEELALAEQRINAGTKPADYLLHDVDRRSGQEALRAQAAGLTLTISYRRVAAERRLRCAVTHGGDRPPTVWPRRTISSTLRRCRGMLPPGINA